MNTIDQDIMARTIYGEARGEYNRLNGGLSALIAVGNVIMNRFLANTFFGGSIQDVCQKPYQFSCWNETDPNFTLIQSVLETDSTFDLCMSVAGNVITHLWPDLTKGSVYYHTQSIQPSWSLGHTPIVQIGAHLFYTDVNQKPLHSPQSAT